LKTIAEYSLQLKTGAEHSLQLKTGAEYSLQLKKLKCVIRCGTTNVTRLVRKLRRLSETAGVMKHMTWHFSVHRQAFRG
jgi:hypothetical protein